MDVEVEFGTADLCSHSLSDSKGWRDYSMPSLPRIRPPHVKFVAHCLCFDGVSNVKLDVDLPDVWARRSIGERDGLGVEITSDRKRIEMAGLSDVMSIRALDVERVPVLSASRDVFLDDRRVDRQCSGSIERVVKRCVDVFSVAMVAANIAKSRVKSGDLSPICLSGSPSGGHFGCALA